MDGHKDTILQIINQDKNKMTSEQFWCVALVAGAFAALIFNRHDVISFVPKWIVVFLTFLLSIWGVWFIRGRHKNYVDLQCKFAKIVMQDEDVPDGWREIPIQFRENQLGYIFKEYLPGYGAYQIIILVLFIFVVICYI